MFPDFGKTFDFVTKSSERSLPFILPVLRQARLFCFPHEPAKVLPTRCEHPEFWQEHFALPYPVTAIEDLWGLEILWDSDVFDTGDTSHWAPLMVEAMRQGDTASAYHPTKVADHPRQGTGRRFFLSVAPSWLPGGKREPVTVLEGDPPRKVDFHRASVRTVQVTVGIVNLEAWEEKRLNATAKALGVWILSLGNCPWGVSAINDAMSTRTVFDTLERAGSNAIAPVRCAVEEVMWFSDPNRFVVEKTTEAARGPRDKRRKGTVKTAEERPTYHSWTPVDIKRVREGAKPSVNKAGEGVSRAPHPRRGHYRVLVSPDEVPLVGQPHPNQEPLS